MEIWPLRAGEDDDGARFKRTSTEKKKGKMEWLK